VPRSFRRLLVPLSVFFVFAVCASAQLPSSSDYAPNLRELVRRSGTILVGTVTAIEFPKTSSSVASVRVTFRVEQGIRGDVHDGGTSSIVEWAGLWSDGPRYRVGERLVLFLYPTSKLGLTSPVAGRWGRWPVDARSRLQLPPGWEQELAASSGLPAGSRLDARNFARAVRRLAEER